MVTIGSYNELELVRKVDFGVYLSDGETDVLLPLRQIPPRAKQGDLLNVFIYTDSEDRIIATMLTPHAVAGGFALVVFYMIVKVKIIHINHSKNLLICFQIIIILLLLVEVKEH